ncbi:putative ribosomal protein s15 [Erysiphe necator]|uniref:Putative ribosomal protein s15 n=1 Tax=Uncinula necator TaxID=52586 RepID=A0A0B1P8Z0_UNCNE|nr:putative ribosomal protein s15 [Erysiphe necator]
MRTQLLASTGFLFSNLPYRLGPKNLNLITAPKEFAHIGTLATSKKHHDPYKLAQIKLRRDANISRQKELQEERKLAMGDPVRGTTTPFVESFDNVASLVDTGAEAETVVKKKFLNFYVTNEELEDAMKNSHFLSSPIIPQNRLGVDPAVEKKKVELHESQHLNAVEAIKRIISLSNASSEEKTRVNISRCIEKFGRHNTDQFLDPRPPVNPLFLKGKKMPEKCPRAGPDTGSSEVQIAILTAKIRVLANNLELAGAKKDKINKRNLRLLVHRRQKLLKYLRRKERGGGRWKHLVNTLGLTEGTWKNEISI